MHEMSLAMNIIDIAENEARRHEAQCITAIEVEVGQLAGVMAEALQFCLETAARGTMADGATICFINTPGSGTCLTCEREVAVHEFPAQCPLCLGYGITITNGTELRIRSISIDEERS